jgi:mRNA interferase RelE/StbE
MMQGYDLHIEQIAHKQRKQLPGYIRQRIRRIVDNLAQSPRPNNSQELDVNGLDVPKDVELRRIRIEKWRLIYAVNESEKWVWVWGVRKRPPYDYEDLAEFAKSLE